MPRQQPHASRRKRASERGTISTVRRRGAGAQRAAGGRHLRARVPGRRPGQPRGGLHVRPFGTSGIEAAVQRHAERRAELRQLDRRAELARRHRHRGQRRHAHPQLEDTAGGPGRALPDTRARAWSWTPRPAPCWPWPRLPPTTRPTSRRVIEQANANPERQHRCRTARHRRCTPRAPRSRSSRWPPRSRTTWPPRTRCSPRPAPWTSATRPSRTSTSELLRQTSRWPTPPSYSSNTVFGQLGVEMGAEKLVAGADKLRLQRGDRLHAVHRHAPSCPSPRR